MALVSSAPSGPACRRSRTARRSLTESSPKRIGQPTASRAVGLANGRNPVSIVVPCHRVIGSNGSMTGYGGGLPRKQFLLGLELRVSGQTLV